ncbi:MAG TPA: hypothetical protein VE961_22955 [Pyrinomonadaceae bacterium]|nr:hypothetical protein [Pyrinomonadaceae bacterium]
MAISSSLILFAFLTACHIASPVRPLSAGALLSEYQQSNSSARQKYDGKEISVRGLARSAATLPLNGGDQGALWLREATGDTSGEVTCWFSNQQAADFSKIRGGQELTIRGVFNGEGGVQLKFCRLVRVE